MGEDELWTSEFGENWGIVEVVERRYGTQCGVDCRAKILG